MAEAGKRGLGMTLQISFQSGSNKRLADLDEDSRLQFETSKNVKVYESFDDMELKEDLLRGLYSYGFRKPSAIQQRAIIPVIKGRDVIAQAQSGTGKTATLSICSLQVRYGM